ncbi:hypothetical protein BpHYR1_002027 [Brachionus plicatilis]|uniref:Uncharacterized protein n=1 Tax=Brachionus plicatilis TaxID=10195 RepID=A0A3M7RBI2_BRAPC|nr:hypothetical protein BpHYR1_002027 [Brachionus plicatilis]
MCLNNKNNIILTSIKHFFKIIPKFLHLLPMSMEYFKNDFQKEYYMRKSIRNLKEKIIYFVGTKMSQKKPSLTLEIR